MKRELNGTRQALVKQECQRCHGLRLADLNVLQFGEENRPEETVIFNQLSKCIRERIESDLRIYLNIILKVYFETKIEKRKSNLVIVKTKLSLISNSYIK